MDNICVAIRVRPINQREANQTQQQQPWTFDETGVTLLSLNTGKPLSTYAFGMLLTFHFHPSMIIFTPNFKYGFLFFIFFIYLFSKISYITLTYLHNHFMMVWQKILSSLQWKALMVCPSSHHLMLFTLTALRHHIRIRTNIKW